MRDLTAGRVNLRFGLGLDNASSTSPRAPGETARHAAPQTAGTIQNAVWLRLFAPVDIASLVCFRAAFGAIMLWEVGRYVSHGWIKRYYIEPTFHFTYYGFGWVRPWPGNGMYWHFYGLGLLAFCMALGLGYRLTATLSFLGFTYLFLLDQTQYLNHFYLICLVSVHLSDLRNC
jgi:hypothetical protein